MGLRRQPKKWEADSLGSEGGFKAFYGYPRAGVSGKSYTVHLLKLVAMIVLVLDTEALRLGHR